MTRGLNKKLIDLQNHLLGNQAIDIQAAKEAVTALDDCLLKESKVNQQLSHIAMTKAAGLVQAAAVSPTSNMAVDMFSKIDKTDLLKKAQQLANALNTVIDQTINNKITHETQYDHNETNRYRPDRS